MNINEREREKPYTRTLTGESSIVERTLNDLFSVNLFDFYYSRFFFSSTFQFIFFPSLSHSITYIYIHLALQYYILYRCNCYIMNE
jgi:hypothetical protein